MPRPKKNRTVFEPPVFTEFKPLGIRATALEEIQLTLDEYEAIRLADFSGMAHEEAADKMRISRSTFSRLIMKSRKKVADFLLHGKLLRIEGGNIHFSKNIMKCLSCGHLFKTDLQQKINECPSCHAEELMSLAGGFGHGDCCFNEKYAPEIQFLNNKNDT
jgi:predicted DNA-binding protein (UPF0251 family)